MLGITSEDVIDTLAELFAMRGVPKIIRSDNGPKLTAHELRHWLDRLEVYASYIEPGSPWENGGSRELSQSPSRDRLHFVSRGNSAFGNGVIVGTGSSYHGDTDGFADSVELMVTGDLFDERVAIIEEALNDYFNWYSSCGRSSSFLIVF